MIFIIFGYKVLAYIMKIDLSIVIPTYNEQGSVSELISSIKKESEKNNFGNFEIIFIDDGSTDETRKILKKL